MPMYLFRGKYTSESFSRLVDKPADRSGAARKVIEAAGGKMHHFLLAFGEHDVIVLMEFPDNASCAAAMMAVAASGALSSGETTVLMTAEEAQQAMKKASAAAKKYSPPTKS